MDHLCFFCLVFVMPSCASVYEGLDEGGGGGAGGSGIHYSLKI